MCQDAVNGKFLQVGSVPVCCEWEIPAGEGCAGTLKGVMGNSHKWKFNAVEEGFIGRR